MSFVLTKGTNEYEGATEFVLVVFDHACVASDNQYLQLGTTATCIAQKKSLGDRARNQINFIMINQRFRNAVKDARAFPGANCKSDHKSVVMRFKLSLKQVQAKTVFTKRPTV